MVRKATYEEQLAIAKATVYKGLHPVDLKRCQAEHRETVSVGNAFIVGGGTPFWERCDRRPSMIAIEPAPEKLSGLRGAMSLCRSCAQKCREQKPDHFFTPSAPFKAAFALGGHQAVRDMVYAHGHEQARRR